MTKQNATNAILERLLAINWKTYPLHTASHKLLLQEHFRRMALWSKALDLTEHWPFFDVAAGVNPSIRATTDQVEILDEHLLKIDVGHYTFLECGWALHWRTKRYTGYQIQYSPRTL